MSEKFSRTDDGRLVLHLDARLKPEFVRIEDYDALRAERDALQSENERLNKWADSFTDSHLKERQTGDALVKEFQQRALAAEAKLAGGVVVPREPTEEMLEAAQTCDTEGQDNPLDAYAAIYKAMLTAATGGTKS